MNAEKFLKSYEKALHTVNHCKLQLEKLKTIEAERLDILHQSLLLPGTPMDGLPRGHGSKDRLATVLAQEDVILRRNRERFSALYDRIAEAKDTMDAVEAAVQGLKPKTAEGEKLKLLLRYRYIDLRTWYWISLELGYKESYVRSGLHRKALEFMEKQI